MMKRKKFGGKRLLRESHLRIAHFMIDLILGSIALSLEADHILSLYPDADTPFEDEIDVINRLLPYHVFQHPKNDLDTLRGLKGKAKMTEEDMLREEIRGR